MHKGLTVLATSIALVGATAAQADLPAGFQVTIEGHGVQNASGSYFDNDINNYGIETFDGLPTGFHNDPYISTFGGAGPISGTYTNLNVHQADQYGGAGGNTNYGVAGLGVNGSYSIDFNIENGEKLTYFGYWLSALDANNVLEFYNNGELLGTFTPTNVITLVGNNGPYYSNPNAPFDGQNSAEPYVFVNFFNESTGFDRIVFKQGNGSTAGYESDNHTVGWWKSQGGTPVPGVPEPTTWAMLILGFGMIGYASRRRTATRIAVSTC